MSLTLKITEKFYNSLIKGFFYWFTFEGYIIFGLGSSALSIVLTEEPLLWVSLVKQCSFRGWNIYPDKPLRFGIEITIVFTFGLSNQEQNYKTSPSWFSQRYFSRHGCHDSHEFCFVHHVISGGSLSLFWILVGGIINPTYANEVTSPRITLLFLGSMFRIRILYISCPNCSNYSKIREVQHFLLVFP